jgi:hypothetical protein
MESSEGKLTRLRQAIFAFKPGTNLSVVEADAMEISIEADDHIGYVYCVRHSRSWDGEVYEYVGETALTLCARLDMHYNTAFSQKTRRLGLTTGGIHHAMSKEYSADADNYRSHFTIMAIRTTKGPHARKDAEAEEVAKLKTCSIKHYNLAEGGGNRPPHLRSGQPIKLVIGNEIFHFPSKTALWASLDDANCPALTKTLRNGQTVHTKARSRWLQAKASGESLERCLGLESLPPIVRAKVKRTRQRNLPRNLIWQRFQSGSPQMPRGDQRDELENKANAAGIPDKLLKTRILRVRYSAVASTMKEAWKFLLGSPPNPTKIEIELPGRVAESRTLLAWGKFIAESYTGQKPRKLAATEIQTRLRNALKHPETLTNDRKLHALGLKVLARSRRRKSESFNSKGPTPRNHVPAEFTNPLTGIVEKFKSTTAMCDRYKISTVVYYTRLKAGWRQAEALYVVIRKPHRNASKDYRTNYEIWIAQLSETERKALHKHGYL